MATSTQMSCRFRFLPYRVERWSGLVREDFAAVVGDLDPMSWLGTLPHEMTRQRLSRQIYRAQSDGLVVYMKVMHGLNDAQVAEATRLGRLKWRWRRSRAMRTLQVSQQMLRSGIECPAPILAARGAGVRPIDAFVSEAVEWASLGSRVHGESTDQGRREVLRKIAPRVAAFHRQRFLHGDMLPNNLNVPEALDRICFMDNDRTLRWPTRLPDLLIRRNLEQFCYRLIRFGLDLPNDFLESYGQAMQWSSKRTAANRERVINAITSRRQRKSDGSQED